MSRGRGERPSWVVGWASTYRSHSAPDLRPPFVADSTADGSEQAASQRGSVPSAVRARQGPLIVLDQHWVRHRSNPRTTHPSDGVWPYRRRTMAIAAPVTERTATLDNAVGSPRGSASMPMRGGLNDDADTRDRLSSADAARTAVPAAPGDGDRHRVGQTDAEQEVTGERDGPSTRQVRRPARGQGAERGQEETANQDAGLTEPANQPWAQELASSRSSAIARISEASDLSRGAQLRV
jgi:hypothetical protein